MRNLRLLKRGLVKSLQDPFQEVEEKPPYLQRIMKKPEPEIRYAMFFTPRSGSSRLTDICDQSGVLSKPGEIFNWNFMPGIAAHYGARDMATYIDVIARDRNTNGVFGCQQTYMHILAGFRSAGKWRAAVKPTHYFWLYREDIVAQAVSISRMRQTRIGHANSVSQGQQETAEREFTYRQDSILGIIEFIQFMEAGSEAFFRRTSTRPMRLSYERVSELSADEVVAVLAGGLGIEPSGAAAITERHSKMTGSKASEFTARFRRENPRFMGKIDRARRTMIARLDDMPVSYPRN